MRQKVSITLSIPIRFKRIANGEKTIEQTGSDETDVDVRDGKMEGESWLVALIRLFADAERETRKSRRGSVEPRMKVQIPTMSNDGSKKPPRANKRSRVDEKLGANQCVQRKFPS